MAPTLTLSSYYRPTSADILVRVAGGNDQTFKPHITADGHYMTFYSLGNNLVPNDANNTLDLFRQDLQTGELLRVSSPALGAPTSAVTDYEVDMSPDGRYVLFSSNADGLVADDNNHVEDLFVRDMVTGSITLVSRKSDGGIANNASWNGHFSPDGTYIVFTSRASDLSPTISDTNGVQDIYTRDLVSGAIERISLTSAGAQGSSIGDNWDAKYTPDGKYIVFSSIETGIVPVTGTSEIMMKNLATHELTLVSADKFGTRGSGHSKQAQISADGHYVVFASAAENFAGVVDANHCYDIYRKDLRDGTIELVSKNLSGYAGNGDSVKPQISADGRYVVFESDATNLAVGDNSLTTDVYRKDMVTGEIVRLSSTVEGGDGVSGGKALSPTMTADGDIVVFDSFSRLTPDDTGNDRDIYWTNTLLKANAFAVKAQQFFAAEFDVGQASSATIAWGDGQTSTVTPEAGSVFFSHAYASGGTKKATVSVTEGGQTRVATYSIDLAAGVMTLSTGSTDGVVEAPKVGGSGSDRLTGSTETTSSAALAATTF